MRKQYGFSPLDILFKLDGYYKCPKDESGRRLGPLVGYVGEYLDNATGTNKQYVGDTYIDFSVAEEFPDELDSLAWILREEITRRFSNHPDFQNVFCGAPMGSLALAYALAGAMPNKARYIYAEKRTLEFATSSSRAKSELFFGRHEPRKGDRVTIVEDVVHNFSTTKELIQLIESYGATVVAIAALMNRSADQRQVFNIDGRPFSVISLVNMAIPEYRQDDPVVVEDIERGNIIWKPKDDRDKLAHAMRMAKK
jgi:orotate phosphoribosyltransferase